MRPSKTTHGERIVKDIKRKTRKQYSAEEKIRIVLDGRNRLTFPNIVPRHEFVEI